MTVRDLMAILEAIANARTIIQQIMDAIQNKTKTDITKELPPLMTQLDAVEEQLANHNIQLIPPAEA